MGYHKGHKEFHALDMEKGWHTPPGYPAGIQQKIIAGELDEKARRGNRTRFLRFAPGVYTTAPFVHEYWEEVFLLSGRPDCRQRRARQRRREIRGLHLRGAAARRPPWAFQVRYRLPASGNAFLS